MARNNKVNMPNSGAGLTRFSDEFNSRIQMGPGLFVILCIALAVVFMVLHATA
jgi:preprotein translocase subunit Sec61beta